MTAARIGDGERPLFARRTTLTLVGLTVALLVARFVTRRIPEADPSWSGLRTLFDFDQEATVPTWWNALLLAAIAVVLIAAGALGHQDMHPSKRSLYVAGGVSGYLATDEAAQIHELTNAPINAGLDRRDIEIDTFIWVIPGVVIAAVLVVVAFRWCRALPQHIGRDLMLAVVMYFSGALGVEAASGWLFHEEADDRYSYAVLVEELLEITAAIVALRAVSGLLVIDRSAGPPALRRDTHLAE